MLELLCIRDRRAGMFQRPFVSQSLPEAIRQLSIAVRKPTEGQPHNVVAEFPEDYDLMRLGNFDEMTGKVSIPPEPELICSISAIQERK